MRDLFIYTLAAIGAVAVGTVIGLVVGKEIVDYIQYQQVLEAVEALVNL